MKFSFKLPSIQLRIRTILAAMLAANAVLFPLTVNAADGYQGGTMIDITTTTEGLMIRLDTGVPTNCGSTPYGWMLIPQASKAMIAVALLMWSSGNRYVVVYTDSFTSGRYCTINQIDTN